MLYFCDKSWIDLGEAGNGREMRVHKVNPMNGCVFES